MLDKNRRITADGEMSPGEFNQAIELLGLSKEEASEWLGLARSTGFRYANGTIPVPVAIGKLLTVMLRCKLRPHVV